MDLKIEVENGILTDVGKACADAFLAVAPEWYPSEERHEWTYDGEAGTMAGKPEGTTDATCTLSLKQDGEIECAVFEFGGRQERKDDVSPMQEIRILARINKELGLPEIRTAKEDSPDWNLSGACGWPEETLIRDWRMSVPSGIMSHEEFDGYMDAVTDMLADSIMFKMAMLGLSEIEFCPESYAGRTFSKLVFDGPSLYVADCTMEIEFRFDFPLLPAHMAVRFADKIFHELDSAENVDKDK